MTFHINGFLGLVLYLCVEGLNEISDQVFISYCRSDIWILKKTPRESEKLNSLQNDGALDFPIDPQRESYGVVRDEIQLHYHF